MGPFAGVAERMEQMTLAVARLAETVRTGQQAAAGQPERVQMQFADNPVYLTLDSRNAVSDDRPAGAVSFDVGPYMRQMASLEPELLNIAAVDLRPFNVPTPLLNEDSVFGKMYLLLSELASSSNGSMGPTGPRFHFEMSLSAGLSPGPPCCPRRTAPTSWARSRAPTS